MLPSLESNVWYYHKEQNNYLIYFIATLDFTSNKVDCIAINKGSIHKGRTTLDGLRNLKLTNKIIKAPNQEILNVLYLK